MSPQARTGLIAFAIVGGLFLLIGGGVAGFVLARKVGPATGGVADTAPVGEAPRADREGVEWNMQEMTDYLQANGLTMRIDHSNAAAYAHMGGSDRAVYFLGTSNRDVGLIYQYKDAQRARDATGGHEAGKFYWGRFRFEVTPGQAATIKKALGL